MKHKHSTFHLTWIGLCACFFLCFTSPLISASVTVSWQENIEPDLAGYKVYYGTESGIYSSIVNVGRVTEYVVDDLSPGCMYYFAVTAYDENGNESGFSEEESYFVEDTIPPTIVSVTCELNDRIRVEFSENLDPTTAERAANYCINHGIVVQSAVLDTDGKTVFLNTTQHVNGNYILTVNNVCDQATVPNTIELDSQVEYTWDQSDQTPPYISTVELVGPNLLLVHFSESLDMNTALDSANYTITPEIAIHSRGINDDFTTVYLNTGSHGAGQTYTVILNNIMDGAGNTIAPNTQRSYTYVAEDTSAPRLIAVRMNSATELVIEFGETLDQVSATQITNYVISPSVTIYSASIDLSKTVVTLSTSSHGAGAYEVTVCGVGDAANPSNLITSASLAYTYTPPDVTPPGLTTVEITNQNILKITFDEPVDEVSATNKANYVINPSLNIESASLTDQRIVILITQPHSQGEYRVTVSGVKDRVGNMIPANTYTVYSYQPPDVDPPSLMDVQLHGSELVELIFDESLDRGSAENVDHYQIQPALSIHSASLVGDSLNKVFLQTAEHQQGESYAITINGVMDRAPAPNTILPGTQAFYDYPLVDTEPPRLISVELQGDHMLELVFNEPLEQTSAENTDHYTLQPSLAIEKATLDASLGKVFLKTGKHVAGTDYVLTVTGVLDRADPPNEIGTENEKSYSCIAQDMVAPQLLRAELHGNNLLELCFSEALDMACAMTRQNYTIDRGISVIGVRLSQSQMDVFLETTSHLGGRYRVTVNGLKDLAAEPNFIQADSWMEYTYVPEDTMPPTLIEVGISDPTLVELTFNEHLDRASAEDTLHYAINKGVRVRKAILNVDMTHVILQTTMHTPGSYTIAINGVRDGSGGKNEIAPNTVGYYQYVVEDHTPPEIVNAVLENDRKMVVQFSEALDLQSAENTDHYVINNNIEVKDVFLTSTAGRVIIETSQHAAGDYILTVNGVKDASVFKNAIAAYSQVSYSWCPVDTLPPALTSAQLHTNNSLELKFSEHLGAVEAKKISNYTIAPHVQIYNVVLTSDLDAVWLNTAAHLPGNYQITVNNIRDRAFVPNTIGSQNTLEYRYIPPDTDAPKLVSVHLKSPMLVEVVFDEELTRVDAENVANYNIGPNITINQASLLANLTTVHLETTSHQQLTSYRIRITGIRDRAPIPNRVEEPITHDYMYAPPDTDPPQLLSVKLQGETLLELIFDEPLEQKSAENRNNYRIVPSVEIQTVTLDTTALRKVLIVTTQHFPGVGYSINVRNVKDRAAIPNTISPDTWQSYSMAVSGGASDNTPPSISRVEIISPSQLDILFTEAVDEATAENANHYAIDDSVEIESIELDSNSVRVHLTTTPHRIGKAYTVSVSNIRDRASQPNVLASAVPIQYMLAKGGASLSSLNRTDYDWHTFHAGDPNYVDRDYTVTQIPQALEGSIQIRTANDDKVSTGDHFLSFELCGEATIYVAYDKHIEESPSWLSGWEITGDQVIDSRNNVFRVYSREAEAGRVVLGGNCGTMDDNMYLVFLIPHFSARALIAHMSKASYRLERLSVGDTYYIDRDYTLASIPDSLENLFWIRTANDDKLGEEGSFLEFTLNHASMVYVAYDENIASLPSWLADWEKLDQQIVDSRSTRFDVYAKQMESGEVTLGGNCGSMDDNMYFVLIRPLEGEGVPDVDSDVPGYFTLTQNYPNPFNPTTTIPYSVKKESHVTIRVFNLLGQTVRILVDEVLTPGNYEVVWDGADERGMRVASGVYFVQLKQGPFAKSRRMLLAR